MRPPSLVWGSAAALAAALALPAAQGSGSPPRSTSPSGGATSSSTMAQGGASSGRFMTGMQGNQMLASKLIGTTVVWRQQ